MRENGRLAKTKACALDDLNSQIYINVFAKKTRLPCFVALGSSDDEHSDDSKAFQPIPQSNNKNAGQKHFQFVEHALVETFIEKEAFNLKNLALTGFKKHMA